MLKIVLKRLGSELCPEFQINDSVEDVTSATSYSGNRSRKKSGFYSSLKGKSKMQFSTADE